MLFQICHEEAKILHPKKKKENEKRKEKESKGYDSCSCFIMIEAGWVQVVRLSSGRKIHITNAEWKSLW